MQASGALVMLQFEAYEEGGLRLNSIRTRLIAWIER